MVVKLDVPLKLHGFKQFSGAQELYKVFRLKTGSDSHDDRRAARGILTGVSSLWVARSGPFGAWHGHHGCRGVPTPLMFSLTQAALLITSMCCTCLAHAFNPMGKARLAEGGNECGKLHMSLPCLVSSCDWWLILSIDSIAWRTHF